MVKTDAKVYTTIDELTKALKKSRQWYYYRKRMGHSLPPAHYRSTGFNQQRYFLHEEAMDWYKTECLVTPRNELAEGTPNPKTPEKAQVKAAGPLRGEMVVIDPDRPTDEKEILQSGAVYYFYAYDTLCEGWGTSLNEVDGCPGGPLFLSELEAQQYLDKDKSDYASTFEDFFIASSDTFLLDRKTIWDGSGGHIAGQALPVKGSE
jgi:hypothetical protein